MPDLFSAPHDDFLARCPAPSRDLVATLLIEPPLPPTALSTEVTNYITELRALNPATEFLDLSTAERIAESSLALLARLDGDLPDRHHRMLHAAIRYFVLDEDGESDTKSILGFDDDAQVLDAALEELGHRDLKLNILG